MYKTERSIKDSETLDQMLHDYGVAMFIKDYFDTLPSTKSRLQYWNTIKVFLLDVIENESVTIKSIAQIDKENIKEINSGILNRYLQQLNKLNKKSTINTKRKKLSSFFTYLTNEGVLDRNPMLSVKSSVFKVNKKVNLEKKLPSLEEMNQLEKSIRGAPNEFYRKRNLAIYYLLKNSGIRKSELVGLDINDLFLGDDIEINILQKGQYHNDDKTTIVIPKSTEVYLSEWLDCRKKCNPKSSALFINNKGKRLLESGIDKIFKNYSNGITPHEMRHFCATMLFQHTQNIDVVKALLGHTEASSVTMDTYVSTENYKKKIMREL